MRRSVILTGVAVFCLVAGTLTRFYVFPRVAVLPANQFGTIVVADPHGSYLNVGALKEVTDAPVQNIGTLRGDVKASNSSVVIWDNFSVTRSVSGVRIAYASVRFALDRHTGMALPCCGANVNGGSSSSFSGIAFKWPFFAQPTTYQFFDPNAGHALPMAYVGTAQIGGLTTYRYTQHVDPIRIATLNVPGFLVGIPHARSVPAGRYYTDTRTYWVEPVSGIPVMAEDNHLETLRDAAGTDRTVLFHGDLKMDAATSANLLGQARSIRFKLLAVHTLIPWADVIAGLLLGAGVLGLKVRARRRAGRARRDTNSEKAAARV